MITFFLTLITTTSCASVEVVEVVRVYDGDTFIVNLNCKPAIFCKSIRIRIAGIDAPEMRGSSDCVKAKAIAARNYLSRLLQDKKVTLLNVKRGKYFRLLATVYAGNLDVGAAMIKSGHAKAWAGTGKRPDFAC